MPQSTRVALSSRPLDTIYVAWFLLHFMITIFIDMVPLYPTALQFPALLKVRADYIADYKDPFAVAPPAWFTAFLWVEGLYQAPLCVWAILGLWKDRPTVPVHLLVYAVQTAVTTGTCLVEIFANTVLTHEEKMSLTWLYGGFALVPGLIGLDMFLRIRSKLLTADGKAVKRE